MPFVRAYINNGYHPDRLEKLEGDLRAACMELVPAGFNSPQGSLTPGSIEFVPHYVPGIGLTADVLLDVEAFDYPDRENVDERCAAIKAALGDLFGQYTFAVWGKLVKAGWASDSPDPEFDGDMSMSAAIERARATLVAA